MGSLLHRARRNVSSAVASATSAAQRGARCSGLSLNTSWYRDAAPTLTLRAPMFGFRVEAKSGRARAGRLQTPHGEIETPVFMPVGTAGAVKAVTRRDLEELGAQVLLANTYHLMLRPGEETVAELGGLHGFTGWPRVFLTDSGGYQVFSLEGLRELSEDGVVFQSHLDGSRHRLTPERSIEVQQKLGADIAMAFDECPAYPATREIVDA